MKKLHYLLLLLILSLAFFLRLYRFDNPIADWHSWRQADTSSVSRNFVENGFDLLHPKYQDISNIPSGKDNPLGYRFVEFPIYNFFQAAFYVLFKGLTLEEWGRIVTIVSSTLSSLFIYFIVKRHLDSKTGLIASFTFSFLPYSIYYSRTILPDEMMVMAILGGILFFDLWLDSSKLNPSVDGSKVKNSLFFLLAAVFTASSFLLKPYALFFTLPMAYLAFQAYGFGFLKKWQIWFFAIVTLLPLVFWRIWMMQYPEGIPASDWLFNGGDIRFKGSFFYWLFAERVSKLILGYFGIFLLFLGIFKQKKEKSYLLYLSFLLSSILYLFVIARGNVQHDYYQILIIPTVSIFVARGALFVLDSQESLNKRIGFILLPIIFLATFSFSWYYIRDYFNVNNWSIVEAGKEVDRLVPKNARIIAPYNGDTSLLYQTKRSGWPAFEKSTEELMQMGATYLVLVNPSPSDIFDYSKRFTIILSSPSYLIIKLK